MTVAGSTQHTSRQSGTTIPSIDGAFIWGGVKDHILNTGGEMLISANDVCCSAPLLGATVGRETFNNVVVMNTFAAAHATSCAHFSHSHTPHPTSFTSPRQRSSFGVVDGVHSKPQNNRVAVPPRRFRLSLAYPGHRHARR